MIIDWGCKQFIIDCVRKMMQYNKIFKVRVNDTDAEQ